MLRDIFRKFIIIEENSNKKLLQKHEVILSGYLVK